MTMADNSWHQTETYKALPILAVETLKFIALINSGAAIAVVTYGLGKMPNEALKAPMGCFLFGLVMCAVAYVLAYITQLVLYNEDGRKDWWWRHDWILYVTLAAAIVAVGSFAYGCHLVVEIMTGPVTPQPIGGGLSSLAPPENPGLSASADLALQAAQQQAHSANQQALAAWVQAIVSGLAIWAAVGISNRQRRAEVAQRERDRADLARDRAMVHARAFRSWDERTRHFAGIVEQDHNGAINIIQLVQGDESLLLPPASLRDLAGNLREFGNAASAVQRAFIALQEFRDMRNTMIGWGLEIAAQRFDHVDLDKVLRLTSECIEAIPIARQAVDALLSQSNR